MSVCERNFCVWLLVTTWSGSYGGSWQSRAVYTRRSCLCPHVQDVGQSQYVSNPPYTNISHTYVCMNALRLLKISPWTECNNRIVIVTAQIRDLWLQGARACQVARHAMSFIELENTLVHFDILHLYYYYYSFGFFITSLWFLGSTVNILWYSVCSSVIVSLVCIPTKQYVSSYVLLFIYIFYLL